MTKCSSTNRNLLFVVAFLCAAQPRNVSAQEGSTTLASAVAGRRVVEQVIAALGGREALRSIRSIETEESIRWKAGHQGLRPSVPGVTYGRRLLSFDVPGQRIAELRLLHVTGNQFWDVGRFLTPQAGSEPRW
jgi:hypothetical protein